MELMILILVLAPIRCLFLLSNRSKRIVESRRSSNPISILWTQPVPSAITSMIPLVASFPKILRVSRKAATSIKFWLKQSLHVLGQVINAQVDIQEGRQRHVHFRDSKLTLILKDSLGGNSKTVIFNFQIIFKLYFIEF